ncbi:MAG: multicopper oxidase domain-containing protein [Ilumatobacteraceae bacterium]
MSAAKMAREDRDTGWWVASFVIGVLALIVASVSFGMGSRTSADSGLKIVKTATEFDVQLGEFFVSPATINVAPRTAITLHVKNAGTMPHDLKVEGVTGTEMLLPGESATIVIGPFDASAAAWCTVPGHKAAGMLMAIHVVGSASEGTIQTTPPGGTSGGSGPADAKISPLAKPAAGWVARDPELPAAPAGTVHEVSLDATETVLEVAPGVTQEMWTFNNQVPGPVLRGKVGDTFRVTLTNRGKIGHSIDFHASRVAPNVEMRTLQPGESLVYEFKADYAGAFMYHCGTAPTLHHIGNGMFGAIIIDPPGLQPVDKEFFFSQSELYLGPQGQPGDLTKMMSENYDAVVFNGYYNQYVHAPIKVDANKRYRIWVVDDGPSEDSTFHIVGTIFDTVFKEGTYTLKPDASSGGSQALDLQPSQGGFVEFSFAVDGVYPFVTHKFADASKGALGYFAVGAVDPGAMGGH